MVSGGVGGDGAEENTLEVSWSIFNVLESGRDGSDVMKRMIRAGNGGIEFGDVGWNWANLPWS